MASIIWDSSTQDHEPYVKPEETYYGPCSKSSPSPRLHIATGGAGQSGLVRALANAFIDDQIEKTGCEPFAVSWLKSDTSASFNYLADGSADLSITYHAAAEEIAVQQGIADRRVYAWRDHFMLVGPKSNPAALCTTADTTIKQLFSHLFRAAVASENRIKFLSRFDKSATNIKESSIWTSIGQTPWSYPYSFFYHVVPAFPYQALEAAAKLGEYTLVDRGTWYGVEDWVRDEMMVFLEGKDDDTTDRMLNPASALVGTRGRNRETANAFADWLARKDGGQQVVGQFAVNGVVLYTEAPN